MTRFPPCSTVLWGSICIIDGSEPPLCVKSIQQQSDFTDVLTRSIFFRRCKCNQIVSAESVQSFPSSLKWITSDGVCICVHDSGACPFLWLSAHYTLSLRKSPPPHFPPAPRPPQRLKMTTRLHRVLLWRTLTAPWPNPVRAQLRRRTASAFPARPAMPCLSPILSFLLK